MYQYPHDCQQAGATDWQISPNEGGGKEKQPGLRGAATRPAETPGESDMQTPEPPQPHDTNGWVMTRIKKNSRVLALPWQPGWRDSGERKESRNRLNPGSSALVRFARVTTPNPPTRVPR